MGNTLRTEKLEVLDVEQTNGKIKVVKLNGVLIGIFQELPGAGSVCKGLFDLSLSDNGVK